MSRISLFLTLLTVSFPLLLPIASAHAQATRTWVSGVGDDANPCSRTAPCKTFAGAISKTARNGEINCLDAGGFGAVTITKSITLDCHGVLGSILNAFTNAINIPFDTFNVADTRRTVRLRNINLNGADTGLVGVRITGGAAGAAGLVFIEGCLIDGNFGGSARGVSDERTAGGKLFVSNTTVRNNGGAGIFVIPGNGTVGGQQIDAAFDNVRIYNSSSGLAVRSAGKIMVTRSMFSGNSQTGFAVGGALPLAEASVSNSTISNNVTGVSNSGDAIIRLSNNDISFNTTAFIGATQSFSNNRSQGNGTLGTAPTPIGSVSNPTGLQ